MRIRSRFCLASFKIGFGELQIFPRAIPRRGHVAILQPSDHLAFLDLVAFLDAKINQRPVPLEATAALRRATT